jgi:putative ABC transport system permease protein
MFARWIFWQRRRKTNDFAEEIRSHLELEAVELETEGMTKEEAERMARVGFGNVAAAQERFNLRHRVDQAEDRRVRAHAQRQRRKHSSASTPNSTLRLEISRSCTSVSSICSITRSILSTQA